MGVRRGMLMLQPQNIAVLGGQVRVCVGGVGGVWGGGRGHGAGTMQPQPRWGWERPAVWCWGGVVCGAHKRLPLARTAAQVEAREAARQRAVAEWNKPLCECFGGAIINAAACCGQRARTCLQRCMPDMAG